MSSDENKCYYCEGKGYVKPCPVDLGDNSPEGHANCKFCGGKYYQKFTCPQCDGSGKL